MSRSALPITDLASRLDLGWARWARPARDGALIAGVVFAVLIGIGLLPLAVDAHAYWAADPLNPYHQAALSDFDAYFYSPAFTQALGPLHLLPWTVFAGLWTFALVLVLAALSGRYLALVVLAPPVFIELSVGNIHLLIAAAIVVGFRWPVAWAFVLLTKVTPGIGLLWFAVRREWRHLAMALAGTAAVIAVSLVIAPGLWVEWFNILTASTPATASGRAFVTWIPLLVRLPVAAAIVSWGALTDRRWTVPVAAIVAMPVLWPNAFAIGVALIPLLRRREARVPEPVPVPVA